MFGNESNECPKRIKGMEGMGDDIGRIDLERLAICFEVVCNFLGISNHRNWRYREVCGMQGKRSPMSAPVDIQFFDRVNKIGVIGARNRSNFDGHIVELSVRPIV